MCTVGLTWSKTDDWFFLMKSILGTEFACSGEGNCSSDHDQKFFCKFGAGRRDMISDMTIIGRGCSTRSVCQGCCDEVYCHCRGTALRFGKSNLTYANIPDKDHALITLFSDVGVGLPQTLSMTKVLEMTQTKCVVGLLQTQFDLQRHCHILKLSSFAFLLFDLATLPV